MVNLCIFDHVKQMITLSVITLSGCIFNYKALSNITKKTFYALQLNYIIFRNLLCLQGSKIDQRIFDGFQANDPLSNNNVSVLQVKLCSVHFGNVLKIFWNIVS